MDIHSLDPSQIMLLSEQSSPIAYTLQGVYHEAISADLWDHYHVELELEFDDLNAIKINTELATNDSDVYISITSDVAVDIYNQPSNELLPEFAMLVQKYTADTTPPQLVTFTLDIDGGILELTFDEAVDPSSLIYERISIHNTRNESALILEMHTFQNGFVAMNDTGTVVVTIELSTPDLAGLQYRTSLALTLNDTFISLQNGTILDMNSNPSSEIAFDSALEAFQVIPDTSPPELVAFDLDLNDNFLILSFSEAVNVSTFNISAYQILNGPSFAEATEFEYLSEMSQIIPTDFSSVLYISLTEEDEDALKAFMRDIATSRNDTYLSIADGSVFDYVGYPVESSPDDVIQVNNFFEGKNSSSRIFGYHSTS